MVLEGPDDAILSHGPPLSPLAKNKQVQSSLIVHPDVDGDEEDLLGDETDEEDGDVILEAGPALVIKDKDPEPLRSPVHHRTTSTSSSEVQPL